MNLSPSLQEQYCTLCYFTENMSLTQKSSGI